MKNIKFVFYKQLSDYKIRLLLMIPVFIFLISIFVIPIFSDEALHNLKGYNNLIDFYSKFFSGLSKNKLNIIMTFDIKLTSYLIFIAIMTPFFLLTEAFIPEKENRTIENLFSLPISDSEILIGKMAVSSFSVIVITVSIYIFLLGFSYLNTKFIFDYLLSFKWGLLIFLLIPLLNFFVNLLTIFIVTKVNKMQTAQYLTIIILSPFFVIYMMIIENGTLLFLEPKYLLFSILLLLILNSLFFKSALTFFNRERILTKY